MISGLKGNKADKCVLAGCGPGMAAEWSCASLQKHTSIDDAIAVGGNLKRLGIKDKIAGRFDIVVGKMNAIDDILGLCRENKRVAVLGSGAAALKSNTVLQKFAIDGMLYLFEDFEYVSHSRLAKTPGYFTQQVPTMSILVQWQGAAGGLYELWAVDFMSSSDADVAFDTDSDESAVEYLGASTGCAEGTGRFIPGTPVFETDPLDSSDTLVKHHQTISDLFKYGIIGAAIFVAGWMAATRKHQY